MVDLYLHIGYPKTGTTAIQQFMSLNDQALKASGVLYPQTGRLHGAHYEFNFSLGIGHADVKLNIPPAEILTEALDREVSESGCDRVVISSEYFCTAKDPGIVKARFASYTIRPIVYLRRHDYAYESAFNQAVKTTVNPPWVGNIDSFIEFQERRGEHYNYFEVLERWASVFGADKLIVRPAERAQNQPDLYADFLHQIGVDDSVKLERPAATINRSLTYPVMVTIDAVQRAKFPPRLKRRLVGSLVNIDNKTEDRPPFALLSADRRASLLERYAESYAAIAHKYLPQNGGVLFSEPTMLDGRQIASPPTTQFLVDLMLRAARPHLLKAEQAPRSKRDGSGSAKP